MTGMAVPLEVAAAVWLATLAIGMVAGKRLRDHPPAPAADPLSGLFAPEALEDAIDRVNRRVGKGAARHAVLRARIDQIEALRAGWDPQTRGQVLDTIAGVMKAGIRRTDSFRAMEGDGFTIVMPGADEHAAKGVADRLRRALAQIRLPQMGGTNPFTASFGIAAGEVRDNGDNLVAHALAALEAARRSGSGHIVAASEIEDVILLPPPDPATRAA